MASKAAKASSSPCSQGFTPPDSPTAGSATPQVTVKYLKHLFGVFLEKALLDLTNEELPNTPVIQDQSPPGPDVVRLKQLLECASAELSMATEPAQSCSASNEQENFPGPDGFDLKHPICTTPEDFQSFEKWASTPQFKTVVETWDKETCKYNIAEPVETSSDLDDYAEYAFVVRERVDRAKRPFHFLPELDRRAENMDNSSDHRSTAAQHLRLLIDHLKQAYAAISQRLESMLQHGHITYDLLWALFKPGCRVYTTCIGTKEPRCVVFDAGEEMTQNDETWLNLECRFLDYDGIKFGEAGIFLRVAKFRGSKPIETLEA
ncbi:unnamed protein product, partial [Penicillium nalgiovense]